MEDDLNIVKTLPRRGYHHGELRRSLIAAGLEIVEEVGPDAFSLRAAARRAGVSAAAPAHHFHDTRGLLTAIATAGFIELGDVLERSNGPDRTATIRSQCHAYVRFAMARPGLFRLMWRKQRLDVNDPAYVAAGRRAFAISHAVVGAAAEPGDPGIAATIACWSLVHGFVGLVMDGAFFAQAADKPDALDTLLDAALARLDLS